jgi:lipopolysaccharide export system permease protein
MKLVDRYIARELIAPFFFGVGAFTSIFIASQLFFKLTAYLAKGAPLPEIAGLFLVRLAPMIVFTFPMAMLLAALLAYGRLSGESELIAMLSCGIPFLRTALPAFIGGALVSVSGLAMNEYVVPHAGRAGERLELRIIERLRASGADIAPPRATRAFVVQDTEPDGQLSRVVVARRFNLVKRELGGVTLIQYGKGPDGEREVKSLVEAERAVWAGKNEWLFYQGRLQVISPVHAVTVSPAAARQSAGRELLGDVREVSASFDRMRFEIRKTPRQMMAQQRGADEMNYAELKETIRTLKEQGAAAKAVREMEVELHNKLAIPFASMVFALVGAPLGLRRLRGGTSVGLGLSVMIIFGYYIVWHGMHVLGEGGQVAPLLASWLPNAIGLSAGFYLIRRAPT